MNSVFSWKRTFESVFMDRSSPPGLCNVNNLAGNLFPERSAHIPPSVCRFPQKFNLLGTCGNLAEPSNPSIRISSNDKKNHPTRFFFGVSDLLLTCFSMENLYVMSFHVEVSTCRGLCPRRSSPAYGAATAVICPIQTSRMLLAFQGSFLDSKRWRHD